MQIIQRIIQRTKLLYELHESLLKTRLTSENK